MVSSHVWMSWTIKKAEYQRRNVLICGVGENSRGFRTARTKPACPKAIIFNVIGRTILKLKLQCSLVTDA